MNQDEKRITNYPAPLASPGHRFGAIAVDLGLHLVTFGIGWFIWNLIAWSKGQTPGKYLLKIRVLNEPSGAPATWGQMLIRQALLPIAMSIPYLVAYAFYLDKLVTGYPNVVGIIALILCFLLYCAILVTDFVWIFLPSHRRLIDFWSGTVVVNEAGLKRE